MVFEMIAFCLGILNFLTSFKIMYAYILFILNFNKKYHNSSLFPKNFSIDVTHAKILFFVNLSARE